MKKILFSAYSLDVGGIETALITLLKYLAQQYEITLALEKKQGIFLEQVPKNVKIITYEPSKNKILILRKFVNFIKQFNFKLKYKNKFDFAGCYATYSMPASFIARTASKNCALWVHNNYMNFYDNDINQYRSFFKSLRVCEFKKIIFVSELDKKVFIAQFPECNKKAIVCNNLIDYEKVLNLSKQNIEENERNEENEENPISIKNKTEKDYNINDEKATTFINIGRHDEKQKKLTRIIEATKKLNQEGYKFKVIFVGKGTETDSYKELSKELNNIEFVGAKKNPYPYLKNSDCLLLSSQFEGYPVVFVEAQILEKPIVTTDVSDSKNTIQGKYGIVVENSEQGVYNGMKKFLEEGFKTEKFNPEEYNQSIIEKLKKIIEKKN